MSNAMKNATYSHNPASSRSATASTLLSSHLTLRTGLSATPCSMPPLATRTSFCRCEMTIVRVVWYISAWCDVKIEPMCQNTQYYRDYIQKKFNFSLF